MITYPVNPETRWAVLRFSTGEIIGRNKAWPVADGSAIPGLDPDFVYLLHIEDARPDYDSRLYSLTGTETVDADANTITKAWAAVKRPTGERVIAAENVEVQELGKHINLERELIETRLCVAAILNYIDGLQLPPKVQALTDDYKAKGIKLWKNRDRLKAVIADIEADNDPDLDAGWEAE